MVSSKRSPVGLGLDALAGRLVAGGDQERHHRAVGREERLHVDDEVLEHRQALDRLDGDRLAGVDVLEQRLAGQPVLAVDPHRVRAADAVRAGAAEGQRAVEVPLDLRHGNNNNKKKNKKKKKNGGNTDQRQEPLHLKTLIKDINP